MYIQRLSFEAKSVKISESEVVNENLEINEKYDKGYSRVVTENGSYKVALIKDIFSQTNY
ncbi:MAG: hypothetical protein IJZ16_13770 [Clostridia bacterium]|nr:hypothetical protein [Clostridia bacterium]